MVSSYINYETDKHDSKTLGKKKNYRQETQMANKPIAIVNSTNKKDAYLNTEVLFLGGYSSVVECLSSIQKALEFVTSTAKYINKINFSIYQIGKKPKALLRIWKNTN
jgi:hypothetical protein